MALAIIARGDEKHVGAWFLGISLLLFGAAVLLRIYAR